MCLKMATAQRIFGKVKRLSRTTRQYTANRTSIVVNIKVFFTQCHELAFRRGQSIAGIAKLKICQSLNKRTKTQMVWRRQVCESAQLTKMPHEAVVFFFFFFSPATTSALRLNNASRCNKSMICSNNEIDTRGEIRF